MESGESYYQRQERQLKRFLEWRQQDGGHEGPTQWHTLFQPHQMARLDWLRRHVTGRVLEAGCNMGHVLSYVTALTAPPVSAHVGLDLNPANIELARVLAPDKLFYVGDVRKLPFPDKCFETLIIAETLEHLDWPNDARQALAECCRVAIDRVLITVPDGRVDTPEADCFKHHRLIADVEIALLKQWYPQLRLEELSPFLLGELPL